MLTRTTNWRSAICTRDLGWRLSRTETTDLQPDNAKAQIALGSLLLAAKQFKLAQDHAQGVLTHDPNNVDAHILLANADAALEDVQQSLTEMQTAIQLAPDEFPRVPQHGLFSS